jgi:hydroxyacylglutathione hydrolase
MIENITENIIRIHFPLHTCNAYFIKDKRILIDTGIMQVADSFKKSLPIAPEDVAMILFTHFHYDHVGCFDVCHKASMYASQSLITSFNDSPGETVYDTETIQHLYEKDFTPRPFPEEELKELGFEIIETPGHAKGSVCFVYDDHGTKVLFSGDLFFDPDMNTVGRTDLPTSDERQMKISLRKMSGITYDILCPGHGKIYKL